MIDTKTSNNLVNEMINSDLQLTASVLVEECKLQWEDRKNYRELKPKKRPQKKLNLLRGVPNKWCEIINFQLNWCVKCLPNKDICSSLHLKNKHGIIVKDILKIWEEDLCPITKTRSKNNRNKMCIKMSETIQKYVLEMEMETAKLKLS